MIGNVEYPLRATITGVDGTGKTTATNIVAGQIGREHKLIKQGPSGSIYTIVDGKINYHYKNITGLLDRLHVFADRTKNVKFIGAVNALSVYLNGRMIEPSLSKVLKPEVALRTRDIYVDSAVYSIVYQTPFANRSMDRKIDLLKTFIGSPFSHIIFFLTASPEEAMKRIEGRIANEGNGSDVKKQTELHENHQTLMRLQNAYYPALEALQNKSRVKIYEINTLNMSVDQVSNFIASIIKEQIKDEKLRAGNNVWIKI